MAKRDLSNPKYQKLITTKDGKQKTNKQLGTMASKLRSKEDLTEAEETFLSDWDAPKKQKAAPASQPTPESASDAKAEASKSEKSKTTSKSETSSTTSQTTTSKKSAEEKSQHTKPDDGEAPPKVFGTDNKGRSPERAALLSMIESHHVQGLMALNDITEGYGRSVWFSNSIIDTPEYRGLIRDCWDEILPEKAKLSPKMAVAISSGTVTVNAAVSAYRGPAEPTPEEKHADAKKRAYVGKNESDPYDEADDIDEAKMEDAKETEQTQPVDVIMNDVIKRDKKMAATGPDQTQPPLLEFV